MRALKLQRPMPQLLSESQWCDSACDRCPLLDRCVTGQSISRRVRDLDDEDGPDALLAGVNHDLNRALIMLENASIEPGFLPEEDKPGPTPALAEKAETCGGELVQAAVALTEAAVHAGRCDEATSARLIGNATLLAVKASRVAWDLSDRYPDPGGVLQPILLLLEHTSAQLRSDSRLLAPFVPKKLAARFAAAHGAMVNLVTPWIAQVSAGARDALRARIEERAAPSPFCRRGEVTAVS
jgi:hypothetical protein